MFTPFLFAFVAAQQGKQLPIRIGNSDSKLAVKVTVDGERIDFKGAPPQAQGSRIMVPLRGIFEHMGASLNWNQQTRTVTARRGESTVVVTVGKSDATINGKAATVETPPIVAQGRVMVPLRFLAQALGAQVEWLGADRTVAITTTKEGTGS
ncbi:hypothetical protein EON82_02620 [bacterium]|nr:MAG: hypothetical protein EON82_02620 [bacterium]